MTLDRRSLRRGFLAGALVVAGMVIGIAATIRLDWMPAAHSAVPMAGNAAPGAGFTEIVKASIPAVVNISTTRTVRSGQGIPSPLMEDPFFRQFFGDEFGGPGQRGPRERKESSLGSGVIVDPSGYIVTNNHVIAKADEIKVLLADKREFTGKVVGTDPKTDIAVIKIDAKNLPTIPWGNSDNLQAGEYALAIGNSFGLNQTVTLGIISAVGRANVGIADYEDFIQTDAAINPGNSGGALINTRGELVGINTAIFSRSGGYMGIGFAVPANMVRDVMQSLIKTGKVVRGWLGVSIQDVSPELAKQFGLADANGALVGEVVPDSPAAKAGFQGGDVIVGYNGKAVDGSAALRNLVGQTTVGKSVSIDYVRDRKKRSVDVKIAEQPANMQQARVDASDAAESTALEGLRVQSLTPDIARQLGIPATTTGVVVAEVTSGSAAEQAGVRPGDVVVQINRQPVRNLGDYQRLVGKLDKKDQVLLLLGRHGGKLFIVISP